MPSETDVQHASAIATLEANHKHLEKKVEEVVVAVDKKITDALVAADKRYADAEKRIEALLRSRDIASRLGMTIIYAALAVAAAIPWQGREWAAALIALLFPTTPTE